MTTCPLTLAVPDEADRPVTVAELLTTAPADGEGLPVHIYVNGRPVNSARAWLVSPDWQPPCGGATPMLRYRKNGEALYLRLQIYTFREVDPRAPAADWLRNTASTSMFLLPSDPDEVLSQWWERAVKTARADAEAAQRTLSAARFFLGETP